MTGVQLTEQLQNENQISYLWFYKWQDLQTLSDVYASKNIAGP